MAGAGHLDPVAHAEVAGLGFLGRRLAGGGHARVDDLVFLRGQPDPLAHVLGALEEQAAVAVGRPHASEVRIAPGGAGRLVAMGDGGQHEEFGVLGPKRRFVLRRQGPERTAAAAAATRGRRRGRRSAGRGSAVLLGDGSRREPEGQAGRGREQGEIALGGHRFPPIHSSIRVRRGHAGSPPDSAIIVTVNIRAAREGCNHSSLSQAAVEIAPAPTSRPP